MKQSSREHRQSTRRDRRERGGNVTVLIPDDLYKNIDYLTSCLQTNLTP